MGEFVDGGEFWLPSEFLADDFFLEEEAKSHGIGTGVSWKSFPCEHPFGSASNLSSPVESVTETESDEEEYVAGLTLQMAHSFLHDDEKGVASFAGENATAPVMAGSPQSTLSAVGSWSFSSRGSPDGPSQVSSPPATPFEQPKDDAWDLLYAAAGQVVRMRQNDQGQQHNIHCRGILAPPRKPSPHMSAPTKNPTDGFYLNPVLTEQQLRATQFYQLKQQQLLKQQFSAAWGRQNRSRVGEGYGEGRAVRPLGLSSSAWPPLSQKQQPPQTQPGTGMRAVFLNRFGDRRKSAGTGVFLPQRIGNRNESRKKPACSTTVLLPARVVQALNLNLHDIGVLHPRLSGDYLIDHDVSIARSNAVLTHQKRNPHRPQPAAVPSHEIRLPPEWTY